jgi:hypothetical protein
MARQFYYQTKRTITDSRIMAINSNKREQLSRLRKRIRASMIEMCLRVTCSAVIKSLHYLGTW